jgi:pimeloyl-ACP methyl ester carboxylesterase
MFGWLNPNSLILLLSLALCTPAAPTCTELTLSVTAHAEWRQIVLPPLSLLNPNIVQDIVNALAGNAGLLWPIVPVGGTYNIAATFCEPEIHIPERTGIIQFLAHGGSYTRDYWLGHGLPAAQAQQYSYAQYASEQGYATLSIDRLGSGQSTRADPLLEVQTNLQAEIVHQIIGMLRRGEIGGKVFEKIAFVGHSLGSMVGLIASQRHPTDFDALVLTGWSTNIVENALDVVIGGLLPAALLKPLKWGHLPLTYLAFVIKPTMRRLFFGRHGSFDPAVQDHDWETRDTLTAGELVTLISGMTASPSYVGPVHVLVGEYDTLVCHLPRTCTDAPNDSPGNTVDMFPSSRNFTYAVIPDAGHCLNLHYSARDTYRIVHGFISYNLGV